MCIRDSYRRQRRTQDATYAIAQAVTSSEGLDDLFARIHRIVAGLMEARNLYIALLDEVSGNLTFPYFRDEIDAEPPAGPVPVGRGLTGYVLRKGEPLLASPEVFDDLVARGEVESIGAASIDWLGVPLRAAVPAYYRSLFLNTTLPGGVLGDVQDTFIPGDYNNYAPGGEFNMYSGVSSGGNINRVLVNFNLSSIPQYATITSATFNIYKSWSADNATGSKVTVPVTYTSNRAEPSGIS